MLIVFGSLDEPVQKYAQVVVFRGQVALDVQSYTPDRDASEPAAGRSTLEGMTDEVQGSDPEMVEDGLCGADEEGDGDARQVGTERLATTGGIVSDNGPGLTGRMENEVMVVFFGRTEAM